MKKKPKSKALLWLALGWMVAIALFCVSCRILVLARQEAQPKPCIEAAAETIDEAWGAGYAWGHQDGFSEGVATHPISEEKLVMSQVHAFDQGYKQGRKDERNTTHAR